MTSSTRHPDLADLVGHFWAPSTEGPVANHLVTCVRCRDTYEKVAAELTVHARGPGELSDGKPETFWTRQRLAIQRSIAQTPARRPPKVFRLAFAFGAAAVLVLVLAVAGWLARKDSASGPGRAGAGAVSTSTIASNVKPPAAGTSPLFEPRYDDPWSSDELQPFHAVVQWETWLDPSNNQTQEGAS